MKDKQRRKGRVRMRKDKETGEEKLKQKNRVPHFSDHQLDRVPHFSLGLWSHTSNMATFIIPRHPVTTLVRAFTNPDNLSSDLAA